MALLVESGLAIPGLAPHTTICGAAGSWPLGTWMAMAPLHFPLHRSLPPSIGHPALALSSEQGFSQRGAEDMTARVNCSDRPQRLRFLCCCLREDPSTRGTWEKGQRALMAVKIKPNQCSCFVQQIH